MKTLEQTLDNLLNQFKEEASCEISSITMHVDYVIPKDYSKIVLSYKIYCLSEEVACSVFMVNEADNKSIIRHDFLFDIIPMIDKGLNILKDSLSSDFKVIPYCASLNLSPADYLDNVYAQKTDIFGNTELHKLAKNMYKYNKEYLQLILSLAEKISISAVNNDGETVVDILKSKEIISHEFISQLESI